jgi:acetyl esterase/lipase
VLGESAGGYLALMVGLTSSADSLEGNGGYPESSSSVQAIVSFFSASDFTIPRPPLSEELKSEMMAYYHKPLEEVMSDFTGVHDIHDPKLRQISPLTYVSRDDPPTLLFQGTADPVVSPLHAQKLDQALKNAGVQHELVMVEGGGHGWLGTLRDNSDRQAIAFLKKILKKEYLFRKTHQHK